MGATGSQPNKRIVLLGKTGDGKSSAGNTILKQKIFESSASPESVTAKCVSADVKVYGKPVTIIDTPGFMDTSLDDDVIKSEIIRSVIESSPGPDIFTIVLKVGRYTGHEIEIVEKIVNCCGENVFKYAVVLFTHGEQLEGQTIEEFVKQSPKLQELVDKCGGHSHVIDSKYWKKRQIGYRSNRVQVKKLLDTIEKKMKDNEDCYTNELLQAVNEQIEEEMKNINEENLSPEEKREKAKKIVHKKLLIRLAGVTTGTLTGAFLGIGVAVASVVALIKAASIAGVAGAAGSGIAASVSGAGIGAAGSGIAAGVAGAGAAGSGVAAGIAGAGAAGSGIAAGAGAAGSGVAAGIAGAGAAGSGITAGVAGAGAAGSGIAAGIAGAGVAGSGVAVGVLFGAAALAGAIGGGVTGYQAAEEGDSVSDAIKNAAKLNYENAKRVVKKVEKQPHKLLEKKAEQS